MAPSWDRGIDFPTSTTGWLKHLANQEKTYSQFRWARSALCIRQEIAVQKAPRNDRSRRMGKAERAHQNSMVSVIPRRFPNHGGLLGRTQRSVPIYRLCPSIVFRLVPVDNSLIFINFMSLLRAKRTDSLTNRFFLLSIWPV